MDLTTIAAALLVALGLLGTDAVINANSVVVEVAAPPKTDKINIDQDTLEEEFEDELYAIAKVDSIAEPPEIHASRNQGLGTALARELKLQDVAYALKSELGYRTDRLRFALYTEDGVVHGLVSGNGRRVGSFRQVLVPFKDERMLDFIHRCAIWGASQLAPYTTALFLLQKHAVDKEFADVVDLIEQAKAKLPRTPLNYDRSAFDNLLGIIQLFHNDTKAAYATFKKAVSDYPANPVAILNAGFAEVQEDNLYHEAADRMERLVNDSPPTDHVLLATAYATWAAAEMGLRDVERADELLAKAAQINPNSSMVWDLWSETKSLKGDKAAAADYKHRSLMSEANFENYAEVAALYFHLSWKDNEPVTLSNFSNPKIITFH